MWLVDPDTGRIVDANSAACDFYGWGREELLRMKVTDINTLPPDQTQAQMEKAHSSPSHVRFHFKHRLANGETRDVEVRSGPVRIGEKRLLFSIIFDISEHKKTQEALRRQESSLRESEAQLRETADHLRIAIQAVSLGIWAVDLEGEVFVADEATKQMHGFAPDAEVHGWSAASRHIHPDDQDLVVAAFLKARETGVLNMEYRVLLPSELGGGARWVYSFGGLDADREHIHGVVMDVTEQRQIEARHREYTTKMEVQGRLLEQREMERKQIARILHDGPLQGLIGLMYAMQFTQDSVKDSELSQKLDQLGEDAKQLVGELRNLCYELQPPAVARFGIKKSIESYLTDFQQVYSLKIHAELPDSDCDLPENISLTLYRIFQEGLRNILLHANADTVHVRLYYEGDFLALSIEDNGAGFTVPENWVEFARQGRFGFVGMNERVEAIGGALAVASQPGQGTTVQVKVPYGE